MSKNELQKVKAFYAKQGECPSIKWTRDANRVQRAVCTKEGNAGVRYISVQMAIMSHLSDAQELIQMGAEGRLRANNHINFAKQLVLTYPDTSIEVSENELNELWKKTM